MAKRYTRKFKFQVVMELLQGDKTPSQVAKAYGIHSDTVNNWKQILLDNGAEVYAKDGTVAEYEQRIAELEQLLGKKEVEIALLKNWFGQRVMNAEEKVAFVDSVRNDYSLTTALSVAELPKSTWYYHQKHKVSLEEKYAHLRPILEEIARVR